jgi:uncharacterized membrane protein (DUF2068 family)
MTSSPRLLQIIAVFKLVKACALLGSLATLLRLIRKDDPTQVFIAWSLRLHVDPDNRYLRGLLARLLDLNGHQLGLLGAGAVVYAILFAAEGVGLLLDMTWAEYLTIVETAGFIPLEVYEIVERLSALRAAVLLGNIAIVAYLTARLRRQRVTRSSAS